MLNITQNYLNRLVTFALMLKTRLQSHKKTSDIYLKIVVLLTSLLIFEREDSFPFVALVLVPLAEDGRLFPSDPAEKLFFDDISLLSGR